MADISITGAEKFAEVAKALKQVADKELSKELYAGLNRSTKMLRADAKQAAGRQLPQRGGLARRVETKARLSTRRRTGRDAGIRIVATGKVTQLKQMDEGKVRHPVYGHRNRWVGQNIPRAEGWFTETMNEGAPEVRKELVKVLDDIARKLARKY